ncbi:MAG: cyclic nucleotide-binding domain-containing protein [Syntrophales bacterium]
MERDVNSLRETEIFKNLSPAQIDNVLNICHVVHFSAQEVIMQEGEVGDCMYIIKQGTVEVIKKLVMDRLGDEASDRNKIFTRLHAVQHHVFGEIALLEESKRTATVRAVTDCTLYEIRKTVFLNLMEADYAFGYRIILNLARIVATRLRKADEDTIKLTTVLSMILKETG